LFARAPGQNLHSSRRAKLLRLVRKINNRGEPKKEILWEALPERGEENEKENGNSMKETYSTGATRNRIDVRWDLLCYEFIREMAVVMHEGAQAHGEPGSDGSWQKGMPVGVVLNHLEEHLYRFKAGDRSEPHLAKVAINAMFLDWYERNQIVVEK